MQESSQKKNSQQTSDPDREAANELKDNLTKAVENKGLQVFYAAWAMPAETGLSIGSVAAGEDYDLAFLMYSAMRLWPVGMREYFLDMVRLEAMPINSKTVN